VSSNASRIVGRPYRELAEIPASAQQARFEKGWRLAVGYGVAPDRPVRTGDRSGPPLLDPISCCGSGRTSSIALGDDADNIRVDRRRNQVVVGYGKGGLATVDPSSGRKIADIPLKGHPESFQFDEQGQRIFVNVPDARQVAVVDVAQGRQTGSLDLGGARSNFPMAVDAQAHRLLVVTRSPARLRAFATTDGKAVANIPTCGDSDDLFLDSRRRLVYVSCGEGAVEVSAERGGTYQSIGCVLTVSGARTSFYVADTDRVYVAVRANGAEPPALWIFRPPR
jgi:hypothetical protein